MYLQTRAMGKLVKFPSDQNQSFKMLFFFQRLSLKLLIFTARNGVAARLCFYTCLSVILFTRGGGHVWQAVNIGNFRLLRMPPLPRMPPPHHALPPATPLPRPCHAPTTHAPLGYYEMRSMNGRYAS